MGQLDEGRHNQLCRLHAAFLERCRLADGTPVALDRVSESGGAPAIAVLPLGPFTYVHSHRCDLDGCCDEVPQWLHRIH